MDLTNKNGKLSKQDELKLLKRAYTLSKNPSGMEIRHLSQIMGRSHATIRSWFEAHKPVDTHDNVDRELQTALDNFDFLDSSEQEDGADDDESDITESDEELITPKNAVLPLPTDVNDATPTKANASNRTSTAMPRTMQAPPPASATGFASYALHNSLVTSAMSKLDTIATIARMQSSQQQTARR
ncbi:hypothetical protein CALVIDRAFT_562229 [Calocera viscosa TUFC12733]|uniref:Homeobox domain-containing protein n=1 Tax=Calocera viscosa (strain TUFC12733) TaxID=1330018 RepID=A0A167P124_CALVF|nr:hypothetical protein CALVIDRAFT_562229 [Calocera viscosa TUFC12733]